MISAVLVAAACTDDRSVVADQAQATGAGQVEPTGPDHVMVSPTELKWAEAPSLPPGAKVSLIEGQLDQPVPFTLRLQLPADYRIPAHRHPALEHVTVLSGAINMGVGDTLDKTTSTAMPTGSIMIMPINTNHFMWTAEEATVQVHGVGPFAITYVNPADDPRTT
ncbi:cupin domain-containing protein [Pseudonocardia charpentierae]|uniref:Cupin domain-containing protein n=1 Tax=Pseudonocardia charpentierae TaxID=3075545 RepID=A0ABU2NG33_9PSEU|nr:cupin domain-containing protein [Pseudonocardia sp. DSM 45834]MDT0352690.1 cupin domain-containing protein [Pseudonocardia sp. DSM 45834]